MYPIHYILDEQEVDYSIISWNREGDDRLEGFQYDKRCDAGHGSASFKAYKGYVNFIKQTIKSQRFNKVIVFGPQMTCLLSPFLLTYFRGRYMIDYRDLSIEQKPGFRQLFALMLKCSQVNVISSPGFKRFLPKAHYYISHNIDEKAAKQVVKSTEISSRDHKEIDILTIGAIRDYESNIEVVKALANYPGILCRFVGKGDAADLIKTYCKENDIKNVSFSGFYEKSEEPAIIQSTTFMNIFYPRKNSHDSALSNRFYNSLVYRKPMIVTKHTQQGDMAEKYQVGISIETCKDLPEQLMIFMKADQEEYVSNCNRCLNDILSENEEFKTRVIEFVTEN